jgi:hypothetical protein
MSKRVFNTQLAAALTVCLLAAAIPVWAHHAFANEYDGNKPITLKGTVTMTQFLNPHSWLYINVKDSKGKMVSWGIEMGTPHDLALQGWSKNSVPAGTEVIVEGFLAKNGSSTANGMTVKLPSGRSLFTNVPALDTQTELIKGKSTPAAR